jgi:hypothetical protein
MNTSPERHPVGAARPGCRRMPKVPLALACCLAVLGGHSHPAGAAPPRPLPAPLYGVTLDAVDNVADTVAALRALPRMPTTRIVFDEGMPPGEYREAIDGIRPVSYIMGEIVDSQYIPNYSQEGYVARTAKYLKRFGKKVDIWEIGNEVNGEWTGKPRAVVRKVFAAHKKVKAKNYRSALTLYYNDGCWDNPDNEMFHWAGKYLPRAMKNGLDYVLVSYYETQCHNQRPDWNAVFARLARMFPNAQLGFGEVGTEIAQDKADYLRRYYTLQVSQPGYIGGYFWWYFRNDMVPMTQPMWQVLSDVLR